MIDRKFWKNKKIFLTGHTGFKGSWLTILLLELGARVTGYSLGIPTRPSLFELCSLKSGINNITGDVRDLKKLNRAVVSAGPDIVIHMAAQPLVIDSYKDPVGTYTTNILGTVNMLEAVRGMGMVKAVLNVTTDKCYENPERNRPFKEGEPLGGFDPYSSSKACSEIVTSAYKRSYGIPVATARSGNVIGGGDWGKDRLVPDIIRAATSRKELLVRNPGSTRPWQHVLDALCGYLILIQKLSGDPERYAAPWNFGPDKKDEKDVEWIVGQMSSDLDGRLHYSTDKRSAPHEAHYLSLDSSKARKMLGWKPKWAIRTAVEKTSDWYLSYLNGADALSLCEADIAGYLKK